MGRKKLENIVFLVVLPGNTDVAVEAFYIPSLHAKQKGVTRLDSLLDLGQELARNSLIFGRPNGFH